MPLDREGLASPKYNKRHHSFWRTWKVRGPRGGPVDPSTREESSGKRDSVQGPIRGRMVIHLGALLPIRSSDTTRRPGASRTVYVAIESLPIRSCFGWGLPSHGVTPVLVSSYLTVSPIPTCVGGLLFCGTFRRSLGAVVNGQPAL